MKLAQQIVPKFGITKCTLQVDEEYCTDEPTTVSEAKAIVAKVKIAQDYGSIAGRFYARPMQKNDTCEGQIKTQNGVKFCVHNEESLYVFVRGGEDYIAVLLEKSIMDKKQFELVACPEEKHLISILHEYLF